MKRTLVLSILIIFFTTSFMFVVGCNNQNVIKEQSKEKYGLQEKCGKRYEEYFNKEYGNGIINGEDGERLISNYANHYN